MIKYLVDYKQSEIQLYLARMGFAKNMEDLGKISFRKLLVLIKVVLLIYYYRIFFNVRILYFPPSGHTKSIYRDMAILLPTKWLFKSVIFHFHASGLSENYRDASSLKRWLLNKCFGRPDLCIRLSKFCPDEGAFLGARINCIVPNGVPDECGKDFKRNRTHDGFNILFAGLLNGTKGELDVIAAVQKLKQRGYDVKLSVAGQFSDPAYESKFRETIMKLGLEDCVKYLGLVKGEARLDAYRKADCFCFPSFFSSEAFPLVLIEAMSFSLPIVASRWRGIPDMVEDGVNGYLVEPKNCDEIAEKLALLIDDLELAKRLGENGRRIFEEKYQLSTFANSMIAAFDRVFE